MPKTRNGHNGFITSDNYSSDWEIKFIDEHIITEQSTFPNEFLNFLNCSSFTYFGDNLIICRSNWTTWADILNKIRHKETQDNNT